MAKAVAKTEETKLPAELMADFLEDAGEGLDYRPDELTIPRLQLIQALSPEVKKKEPKYIEDAEVGDIFNTVTRDFWSGEDGIRVVICFQTTRFNEWIPREQGGGFVQELSAESRDVQQATREGARETLPNGNELVKTEEHYVLVEKDGIWSPAIIGMTKTQLKVSRRWKSQIMLQTVKINGVPKKLPLFGTIWTLKSIEETNKNNESYMNWDVHSGVTVDDPKLYAEAKDFRTVVQSGDVKPAPEQDDSGASPATSDDIPF